MPRHRLAAGLKLAAISLFVLVTNPGLFAQASQFIEQRRWTTLAVFLVLWVIAYAAIVVATFQRNLIAKLTWATLIALSTAVGYGFFLVSGNEVSMFDAASLWTARHEAGRALQFYLSAIVPSALVFIVGFIIIAAPARFGAIEPPKSLRFAWRLIPAAPILILIAVIYFKEGGGSYGMPTQFAPISVAALSGAKIATHEMPPRRQVSWQPGKQKIRNVILIVDESVRADYIDWRDGNSHTPEFAKLKHQLVDFGPAVSAATCSSYSNAILRFGASRHDLMQSVMSNATIWQYAKAAGFKTVFIDAQAAFVKGPDKLQNFMTAAERQQIDSFHVIDETTVTSARDDKLVDILATAVKSDAPTFIYAVKNGAHFPYDLAYPSDQRVFRPTMSEAGRKDGAALINSYRNAVRWSVDRIFGRLIQSVPLDDTLIIYTSDHGQNLSTSALSHCSTENPDPREALVPLIAATGNKDLRNRLATQASHNKGQFTHFSIVPTILSVFGYEQRDISSKYAASLFDAPNIKTEFTSGDIFGLVASTVRMNKIDLSKNYLEKQTAD